jgi:hypothetical protein
MRNVSFFFKFLTPLQVGCDFSDYAKKAGSTPSCQKTRFRALSGHYLYFFEPELARSPEAFTSWYRYVLPPPGPLLRDSAVLALSPRARWLVAPWPPPALRKALPQRGVVDFSPTFFTGEDPPCSTQCRTHVATRSRPEPSGRPRRTVLENVEPENLI